MFGAPISNNLARPQFGFGDGGQTGGGPSSGGGSQHQIGQPTPPSGQPVQLPPNAPPWMVNRYNGYQNGNGMHTMMTPGAGYSNVNPIAGGANPLTLPHHLPNPQPQPQPPPAQVPGQTVQSLPAGTSTQPGNVAATAPLPYQSFGQVAQIDPAMLDPQAYYQQYQQMVSQGMQPYFQQQDQQLNDDLRARGIQNSGAAGDLMGNLYAQQAAQVSQGALQYGTQSAIANQNAANEAALYNANAYQGAVNQNYDAYNNYLQQLLGLGAGESGALQSAYLNSFGPSTGVQGAYGSALSGTQNVFGNVYGSALGAQQQQMNELGTMMAMGG